MGMGMGCTMMPIMTAALATLTNQQVARGSTLMNIVQQTARLDRHRGHVGGPHQPAARSPVSTARRSRCSTCPRSAAQEPPGRWWIRSWSQAADAFGNTFLVATVLIALTLIPAFLLPRKKSVNPKLEAEGAPTVMMH